MLSSTGNTYLFVANKKKTFFFRNIVIFLTRKKQFVRFGFFFFWEGGESEKEHLLKNRQPATFFFFLVKTARFFRFFFSSASFLFRQTLFFFFCQNSAFFSFFLFQQAFLFRQIFFFCQPSNNVSKKKFFFCFAGNILKDIASKAKQTNFIILSQTIRFCLESFFSFLLFLLFEIVPFFFVLFSLTEALKPLLVFGSVCWLASATVPISVVTERCQRQRKDIKTNKLFLIRLVFGFLDIKQQKFVLVFFVRYHSTKKKDIGYRVCLCRYQFFFVGYQYQKTSI